MWRAQFVSREREHFYSCRVLVRHVVATWHRPLMDAPLHGNTAMG
ncbi:MAG TPA: hypothetical protein VF600_19100 [Abditibacteriaceae bacterium]